MIALIAISGFVAVWSFVDAVVAMSTAEHDPAIYLRVAVLATVVTIALAVSS